jgi:hypothetical protein
MKNKELIYNIQVPKFENYIRAPYHWEVCKKIDATRLLVEILWWLKPASEEFKDSDLSSKLSLDWQHSLVIRYKREKDWKYYPVCALSFDVNKNGIIINQLQWSTEKKVAYRFSTYFNTVSFYLKLIEESFSSKWIFVSVVSIPKWTEEFCSELGAMKKYERLRMWIEELNKKYWLKENI